MASDAMTLARWGYLLYGGWVLGNQALAARTDLNDGYYGLGAQDHGSSFGFGVAVLGHAGTVPGYTAQLMAFPEEGLAVAVLMNTNGNEGELNSIGRAAPRRLSAARGAGHDASAPPFGLRLPEHSRGSAAP